MSTTRQAYRLGTRLSLGRLFGFYYAHIGYYVGQLHFYHATYGMLALTFLGALADGTGLLPGAASGAVQPANSTFSLLFLLFFAASLLPLIMMLLAEQGPSRSLLSPLSQLLSCVANAHPPPPSSTLIRPRPTVAHRRPIVAQPSPSCRPESIPAYPHRMPMLIAGARRYSSSSSRAASATTSAASSARAVPPTSLRAAAWRRSTSPSPSSTPRSRPSASTLAPSSPRSSSLRRLRAPRSGAWSGASTSSVD